MEVVAGPSPPNATLTSEMPEASFTYTLLATSPGRYVVQATVLGELMGESITSACIGEITVLEAACNLSIRIEVNATALHVGQAVEVKAVIENTGSANMTNIRPIIACNATCKLELIEGPVPELIPQLPPGSTAEVKWVYKPTTPGEASFIAGAKATCLEQPYYSDVAATPAIKVEPTTPPPPPQPMGDLSCVGMQANSTSPSPGEPIKVTAEVKSTGLSTSFKALFTLGELPEGYKLGETRQSIEAGEVKQLWIELAFQNPGDYTIYVYIDPYNVIQEANEENNMCHITITVPPLETFPTPSPPPITTPPPFPTASPPPPTPLTPLPSPPQPPTPPPQPSAPFTSPPVEATSPQPREEAPPSEAEGGKISVRTAVIATAVAAGAAVAAYTAGKRRKPPAPVKVKACCLSYKFEKGGELEATLLSDREATVPYGGLLPLAVEAVDKDYLTVTCHEVDCLSGRVACQNSLRVPLPDSITCRWELVEGSGAMLPHSQHPPGRSTVSTGPVAVYVAPPPLHGAYKFITRPQPAPHREATIRLSVNDIQYKVEDLDDPAAKSRETGAYEVVHEVKVRISDESLFTKLSEELSRLSFYEKLHIEDLILVKRNLAGRSALEEPLPWDLKLAEHVVEQIPEEAELRGELEQALREWREAEVKARESRAKAQVVCDAVACERLLNTALKLMMAMKASKLIRHWEMEVIEEEAYAEIKEARDSLRKVIEGVDYRRLLRKLMEEAKRSREEAEKARAEFTRKLSKILEGSRGECSPAAKWLDYSGIDADITYPRRGEVLKLRPGQTTIISAHGKDTDLLVAYCQLKEGREAGYASGSTECSHCRAALKLNDRLFFKWHAEWVEKGSSELEKLEELIEEMVRALPSDVRGKLEEELEDKGLRDLLTAEELRELLDEAEDKLGAGRFLLTSEGECIAFRAPLRTGRIRLTCKICDSGLQYPDPPRIVERTIAVEGKSACRQLLEQITKLQRAYMKLRKLAYEDSYPREYTTFEKSIDGLIRRGASWLAPLFDAKTVLSKMEERRKRLQSGDPFKIDDTLEQRRLRAAKYGSGWWVAGFSMPSREKFSRDLLSLEASWEANLSGYSILKNWEVSKELKYGYGVLYHDSVENREITRMNLEGISFLLMFWGPIAGGIGSALGAIYGLTAEIAYAITFNTAMILSSLLITAELDALSEEPSGLPAHLTTVAHAITEKIEESVDKLTEAKRKLDEQVKKGLKEISSEIKRKNYEIDDIEYEYIKYDFYDKVNDAYRRLYDQAYKLDEMITSWWHDEHSQTQRAGAALELLEAFLRCIELELYYTLMT
ncbi:MAG: hypothetical protein DRN96_07640 [Thermoproteota archaeon]|nr:MAG: hypothetical protein DRN96_07640 [Candidatus Korarchaeota archaeon]